MNDEIAGLRKFERVAESIRGQIADGRLKPGERAPSAAALSRETGYATLTCRRALRILIADGSLVPGSSPNSRARIPNANGQNQTLADAKRELSAALAGYRHAACLTQPQLAAITGRSVTSVGHAETARLWQSRPFWERADKALNAGGELLRLHDAYRAAEVSAATASIAEEADPAEEPAFSATDTADEWHTAEGPPTPAFILVVWTDGAVTAVPVTRDA